MSLFMYWQTGFFLQHLALDEETRGTASDRNTSTYSWTPSLNQPVSGQNVQALETQWPSAWDLDTRKAAAYQGLLNKMRRESDGGSHTSLHYNWWNWRNALPFTQSEGGWFNTSSFLACSRRLKAALLFKHTVPSLCLALSVGPLHTLLSWLFRDNSWDILPDFSSYCCNRLKNMQLRHLWTVPQNVLADPHWPLYFGSLA